MYAIERLTLDRLTVCFAVFPAICQTINNVFMLLLLLFLFIRMDENSFHPHRIISRQRHSTAATVIPAIIIVSNTIT